jgi:urea transport system permease protein
MLAKANKLLNGPQTMGKGPAFWTGFVVVVLGAVAYPAFADGWTVGNTVYFFNWIFMALGLSLIWGYGGALSFGQTAFFGLAGYAYGILTLNYGSDYGFTILAVVIAVAISAVFAAVLGYFLFFGRISGVFLGIVTLSVTLVFERFMAQTAGPEWAIGAARLNGFNGMSGMPPLTLPWFGG